LPASELQECQEFSPVLDFSPAVLFFCPIVIKSTFFVLQLLEIQILRAGAQNQQRD
jgi:hypothetical protein